MRRAALALAALAAGAVAQQDPPRFLRIALHGSDISTSDGMIVSWTTSNAAAAPGCKYGPAGGPLSSSIAAETRVYLAPNLGGSVHYHAAVTGLEPASTYTYSCGDDAAGWSAPANFTTGTAAAVYPFQVIVYGDMGVYNSNESMTDIGRIFDEASLTWHIGDVSYADDAFLHTPLQFHYEKTYDEWMTRMADYLQQKPYMVLPGNHEAECHSPACILDGARGDALANFSAYNGRWRMPIEPSGSTTSMWYSFRFGRVHFSCIDTETDFPGAPDDAYAHPTGGFGNQLAWLERDLAAAAAARAAGQIDWILVGGHRPWYTRDCATADGVPRGDCAAIQASFEPLLLRYGVDAYFAGHVHDYESIWPTANSTLVHASFDAPPFPAYVVTGAAGNTEGLTKVDGDPQQPWLRTSNDVDYGISRITLRSASEMDFEFRRATDGAVLDSWTLVRGQH